MTYELDLTEGVARLLAGAGIAEWDPAARYAAAGSLPVILIQAVPEIARSLITLTPYNVASALAPNDSVLGLQVRTRAPGRDPRAVMKLDGAIYAALHGRSNLSLGPYRVTKILHQSGSSLGQDGSDRWGRTANYYITGPRP